MTRKEAIDILVGVIVANSDEEAEALDMAIEALQTDIVRCDDCKYKGKVGDVPICRIHEISTRADDYCSRGERSKDE